ncbi:MAG: hypothetical protein WCO56_12885, partial [Verrucomicrobiota bacterium]
NNKNKTKKHLHNYIYKTINARVFRKSARAYDTNACVFGKSTRVFGKSTRVFEKTSAGLAGFHMG